MFLRVLRSASVWLAALGGSALLFAAAVVVVHEAKRVHGAAPASVTTVDYFSGTTHYAVPMKYHPGITHYSEKRNYSALTLMLFLPDLSPAAEHLEEMKRPGWHDQMTLLIEHGPHVIDPDAQVAWMTNFPRGVHTLPEPAANGCEVYRTPLMMPGDVFVCPEDGSKLVISCDRKSDIPYPACTGHERIREDLTLVFAYSIKYAGDASSIDQRVKALIASFVTSQTVSAK